VLLIFPLTEIILSFLFHLFFSVEIFFFPNFPPFYLWNPTVIVERMPPSLQWNPQIFISQTKVFIDELKYFIENYWATLGIYKLLYNSGKLFMSPVLITISCLIVSYIPMYPVLLLLVFVTILLIVKNLLILTGTIFGYLTERIIDGEITDENNKGNRLTRIQKIDPTLVFIGKQLINFSIILLTLFSALAIFYPLFNQ